MIDAQRRVPEGPATPSTARRRGWDRRGFRLAAGTTAALLVLAGAGPAWAAAAKAGTPGSSGSAPSGGRGAGSGFTVSGTLKSVGKSSLAFKLTDGTVATATLSSSTTYTKTVSLKVSALKKGDTVTVTGTTANGVLAATQITLAAAGGFANRRPPSSGTSTPPRSFPEGFRGGRGNFGEGFGEGFRPGGANFPTFGTIAKVSGTSFTLTEANKSTVKVSTSKSTAITESERTTKKGLTIGKMLTIRGVEKSNTVVAAQLVSQGNPGFGGFLGGQGRTGRPTGQGATSTGS